MSSRGSKIRHRKNWLVGYTMVKRAIVVHGKRSKNAIPFGVRPAR